MDESLKKNCPFVFGEIGREALSTMNELTDQQLYQVYKLSVNAGEHGTVSPSINDYVKAGSKYTFTATPNEGYVFSSWSDGISTNPRQVTVNANTDFTAAFSAAPTPTTFTVFLTSADASKGKVKIGEGEPGATASQSGISSGTQVSISAVPETGFVFEKWSDEDTNATRTITVAADVTLTATFISETSYTVTLSVAEGQSDRGTVSGGGQYPAGSTIIIAASPATGYHFEKWSDNNTTQSRSITVNEDLTLVATFAADAPTGSITVTLSSANANQGKVQIGSGTIGATATTTVQSGQTVTIKGIPEPGYSFLEWSDGNESWERQITPTENTTLTASFEAE